MTIAVAAWTGGPVLAQAQQGAGPPPVAQPQVKPPAKPAAKQDNACMTPPQLEADAIVRAGIVLRAYARDCARRGIDATILPKWSAFDTANAQNLRQAVQMRDAAYARNYPDDPYAAQRVIDETLTSRGITRPSVAECRAAADVVDQLKTWNDFINHVRRTELGMVKTAIKTCSSGRGGTRPQP